jgi:undecaprenyl-diphosphatase
VDAIRQSGLLGPRPRLFYLISAVALITLIVSGMVFAELLEYVLRDGWFGTDVDLALSEYAADHRSGWLTTVMRQVTDLGGTAVLMAIVLSTIATMLLLRRRRLVAVMLIAAVGSSALTVILKAVIERPRPITNGEIIFASDSSFPSGHTLESAAIYGALVIIVGSLIASRRIRIGVWAIGAAIAIGIGASRVYLGVHWASDVAAGWLIGFALVVGIVGLIALDKRVTHFLRTDSWVQTFGARGSILGIVSLAIVTAFLVGAEFGP